MLERWPRPLLIGSTGEQQLLQASPVGKPPFSERDLQLMLARYPSLLPVTHFDPLFGPPLCIGRGVSTDAGPLDLLYISHPGYLTIVETKLWKSSEARRKVVAQIIDYTREVVRWDFAQLNAAFVHYARQSGIEHSGLIPYVADHADEDLDEMAFTDAVTRSLRLGRLLLLIVGDGIREGVEEMTSYLQTAPNLQFSLGLVEIGCYSVTSGAGAPSTLLVPRVVMRTAEVPRAIVQIQMSEEAARQLAVITTTPPAESVKVRTTLSKTEFYELLQKSLDAEKANQTRTLVDRLVLNNEGLQEDFTTNKLAIRADLPSGEFSSTLLYISTNGAITVYRWLAEEFSKRGLPVEAVNRFLTGLHRIDANFPARVNDEGQIKGFKAAAKNAALTNILPKFPEVERLIRELIQNIDREAPQAV
jgi:hypothetical protein